MLHKLQIDFHFHWAHLICHMLSIFWCSCDAVLITGAVDGRREASCGITAPGLRRWLLTKQKHLNCAIKTQETDIKLDVANRKPSWANRLWEMSNLGEPFSCCFLNCRSPRNFTHDLQRSKRTSIPGSVKLCLSTASFRKLKKKYSAVQNTMIRFTCVVHFRLAGSWHKYSCLMLILSIISGGLANLLQHVLFSACD